MYLKTGSSFLKRTPSITSRLTLYYALATFCLLALIAIFLYGEMINILYENDKQFLANKIDVVHHLLLANDNTILKHEIHDTPSILEDSNYHYYIRVLDSQHQAYIETPGMKKILQGETFYTQAAPIGAKVSTHWISQSGNKYLLTKAIITLDRAGNDVWQIQAALDISYQHAAIVLYRNIAFFILFGGEFFAILFGYFIARHGLKRLHVLIRTARMITAKSLHQRIESHSWPKELQDLGLAFNDMLNRIEAAFSHLTQFSADLAHELRTPINNLLGETEIALSRSVVSADEFSSVLVSNMEELQRISQIIENILFIAKTENPQLDLVKQTFHLENELQIVAEFYDAMAADKNINIYIIGHAEIKANQVMIRRLFSNLISNALKYTEAGGTVECKISITQHHKIKVTVQDTGVGIAPEHLPKIFNRFYRVDSARAQYYGSVGLGLAIAKSIVNLHHGNIEIASSPQQGTTVTVYFDKLT